MPSQQVPKSRYANVKTRTAEMADGKTIEVLDKRYIPEPTDSQSPQATWVEVERKERLDSVADRLWQNPTEYWHLMDAVTCLQVQELEDGTETTQATVPSARLLLPEEK